MPKICLLIAFSAGVLIGSGLSATAQQNSCAALKNLVAPDVTIESAERIPESNASTESTPGLPPFPKEWKLPANCRVRGVMHARTGSDGNAYGIHFELSLPTPWNGKFLFQGGGGTDGVVQPALGLVNFKDPPALSRGYAVVTTDSGHTGGANTAFGLEQQARLDYAFNAIGEVTRTAKQLVAAYYNKPPNHSYFFGCSNGGREAMMAVQRYPLEFDGAVAGDPGFRLSHAAIAEAWDTEAFSLAAPVDEQKRPILSKSFSTADLALVSKAVLDQCDALDGIRDGEINNVAQCKFDPEVLICEGEKTPQCLSRSQVDALNRSFAGAHDSKGSALYSSWPYDAGIGDMGWRIWKLGTSETATSNAISSTLGWHALTDYFVHPYITGLDVAHIDFDKIALQVEATRTINDPVSTELGTFASRGGKLMIYEGVSDPVFSANDLINYYQQLAADNGGLEKARSIARLFLIPGMAHCGGGPATDEFDTLSSLERWVEEGKAPERIIATGRTFPGRTRPLCAFPKYASYTGSGDSENAVNFECK